MVDMELWLKYLNLAPENYLKGFLKLINHKIPGFRLEGSSKIPRNILKQPLTKKNNYIKLKNEAKKIAKIESLIEINEDSIDEIVCETPEQLFTHTFVLITNDEESFQKKAIQLLETTLLEKTPTSTTKNDELEKEKISEIKKLKDELKNKERIIREIQSKTSKEINELKKQNKKIRKDFNILKSSISTEKATNKMITNNCDILQTKYNEVAQKLQVLLVDNKEKQLKINDLNAKLLKVQKNDLAKNKKLIIGIPQFNLETVDVNDFDYLRDQDINEFLEEGQIVNYDLLYIVKSEIQYKNFIKLRKLINNTDNKIFENFNELKSYVGGI
jgi:hypothetical protein